MTIRAAIAALLLLLPLPAWTADLTATPETQAAVLAQAKGGDTLTLIGAFGGIQIKDRAFSPPLSIDARSATFQAVAVRNVEGLVWKGGQLRPPPGPARRAFIVSGSTGVNIAGVTFEGDGLTDAFFFDDSADLTLTGSWFERPRTAVLLRRVRNARIEGNSVWRWTNNGVALESVRDSTITRNGFMARWRIDDVHPDAIQGLQSQGDPNLNITISFNTIISPDTQGIFIQKAWDRPGYVQAQGIKIVGNVVVTSDAPNGIVSNGDPSGEVRDNRVSTLPGSKWQTQIKTDAPVREGNIVAEFGRRAALAD